MVCINAACGKEFTPINANQKSCSSSCYQKSYYLMHRETIIDRSKANVKRWLKTEKGKRYEAIKRMRKRAIKNNAFVEQIDPFVVFERANWACYHCGRAVIRELRGLKVPAAPTVDHLVPFSKGGKDEYSNCVCSCYKCNVSKKDSLNWQPK